MASILITGATGNVGRSVLKNLFTNNEYHDEIFAGVRNIEIAQNQLSEYQNLQLRKLDFTDTSTFENCVEQIDYIFLLRPPDLSNVNKYFKPFLLSAKKAGVKGISFLSVFGADKSNLMPHHKIENLIIELGFDYIFLRPTYFMQNLTTHLLKDIIEKNKIFLPGGKAKFNWIDVEDLSKLAAKQLLSFHYYKNDIYKLTGEDNLTFEEVCQLLSEKTGRKIWFENPWFMKYFLQKNKEGHELGFIMVMIMIHLLPALLKIEDRETNTLEKHLYKKPTKLEEFIERELDSFKLP